ncbi:MAG: hypothetical protein U1F77_14850 [Kiritimatiellia bacterium]
MPHAASFDRQPARLRRNVKNQAATPNATTLLKRLTQCRRIFVRASGVAPAARAWRSPAR